MVNLVFAQIHISTPAVLKAVSLTDISSYYMNILKLSH